MQQGYAAFVGRGGRVQIGSVGGNRQCRLIDASRGADEDDAQNEVAMAAANDQGGTNLNEFAERDENEE